MMVLQKSKKTAGKLYESVSTNLNYILQEALFSWPCHDHKITTSTSLSGLCVAAYFMKCGVLNVKLLLLNVKKLQTSLFFLVTVIFFLMSSAPIFNSCQPDLT